MRIAIVGTGYVGLVSGACFADFGHAVVCVDKDAGKIAALKNGQVPIYEPGLAELLDKQVKAGRISFTTDISDAVPTADAVFIAVGTPEDPATGQANLSYVWQAAREIAQHMNGYTVIVDKSTVPVGTAREVERIVRETRPDAKFDVASNPEFLREGAAIQDFMKPERVVIGVESPRAQDIMRKIYQPLEANQTPIILTKPETAEIIKYASNAFLATKLTFINEIADLCEKTGADVQVVSKAMGLDSRIGPKFLQPGPGYGGSCFPKDTHALASTGRALGAPQHLVETVLHSNEERRERMAQRIIDSLGGDVAGKTIAVLGTAFKPDTDDVRESPALSFIPLLQAAGAKVTAYDPAAMETSKRHLQNVDWKADAYKAAEGADAAVIATEWKEFRTLDFDRLNQLMKAPVLIDLRNIYNLPDMERTGFRYVSIGRPEVGGDNVVSLCTPEAKAGNNMTGYTITVSNADVAQVREMASAISRVLSDVFNQTTVVRDVNIVLEPNASRAASSFEVATEASPERLKEIFTAAFRGYEVGVKPAQKSSLQTYVAGKQRSLG